MTPELARMLLPIVNDKLSFETMIMYAEARMDIMRRDYDSAPDFNSVARVQGAIQELRRFKSLRDEVFAALKMDPRKPAVLSVKS